MLKNQMKAIFYHAPLDVRVANTIIPKIEDGEMLIRVKAASICGTDLRIYYGSHRMYPPGTTRIPGHEVVGIVEQVKGYGDQGFAKGDLVFVAPNAGCGHCLQCIRGKNNLCQDFEALGITINGGFAEYMRVPAKFVDQGNVILLEGGTDPASAALIEPFACVLRGQNALNIQPGENVLIIGAGPIGLMHAMLAVVRGAGKVVISEVNQDRINESRRMGFDHVIDPGKSDLLTTLLAETNQRGADVVIVAAPVRAAQEQALDLAAIGGRINYFGGLPKQNPNINFDSNKVHYKELVVTGTTACSTADCRQAVEIVRSKSIDLSPLVSQKFLLENAQMAFQTAEGKTTMKIVFVSEQ